MAFGLLFGEESGEAIFDCRPYREMRFGDLLGVLGELDGVAGEPVGGLRCTSAFAGGDLLSAVPKKPAGGAGNPPSFRIFSQVASTLPER